MVMLAWLKAQYTVVKWWHFIVCPFLISFSFLFAYFSHLDLDGQTNAVFNAWFHVLREKAAHTYLAGMK